MNVDPKATGGASRPAAAPRTVTEFLLIRHAQSANNALPAEQRVCDPPLTELGERQAELLADHLMTRRIDFLYCSGFLRSLQTAAPLAARTGLRPYVHSLLFESKGCYSGHLEGQLQPESGLGRGQIADQFGPWEIDPDISEHGWHHNRSIETDEELGERAAAVARWMVGRTEQVAAADAAAGIDDEVLVHAAVIHADFKVRLLLELFAEQAHHHAAFLEADPLNTSITVLRYDGGGWHLLSYNDVSHLSEGLRSV